MRPIVMVCAGLLACSGSVFAQDPAAVVEPVPPVAAPEVGVVDEGRAMASRAQALARLAPELKVTQETFAVGQCGPKVRSALSNNAYQVFVRSASGQVALAPLLFDVGLRSRPDEPRLASVCQGAQAIVVLQFSEKVRRSADPAVQRDYVVALTLADWAQAQLEGTGLVGREIPADVSPDPFRVLARLPAAAAK